MKKILFCFLISFSYSQTTHLDSLTASLSGSTGKERLAILFELANALEMSVPKEALNYAREGIALAEQFGDSASLATLYSSAAFSSSELGDFVQSLRYGGMSLEVATRLGDKKKIASANSTLGITYVYLGRYSSALDHHFTALRLREELGLTQAVTFTYNNIGIVYHNIGQYDKAIEYYTKAYDQQKKISSDPMPLVRFLTNIGFSEFKRGNITAAMKYHNDAAALAEKYHYTGGLAYILFNLGIMNAELKEYRKALDYLHGSLQNNEALGRKYGITEVLNALGSTYFSMGNEGLAEEYFQRAAVLGRELNTPVFLKKSYEMLSEISRKRGDAKQAFRYYRLYSAEKDSLYNLSESIKIADLSIQMEVSAKQREIELLKKEKTISDITHEKEKSQFRFTIAWILILGAVVALLYFNNRKIRGAKRLVDQKNQELEGLTVKLQEQIAEVKALSGLLPICSNCKKIRDDKGYWKQLETYISTHSEAKFSHSICPSCMEELYPGFKKSKK